MGLNLVLNKMTGRIIDVPDNHYALNPAEWPRGRAERNGKLVDVYAEEYELLDASEYEYSKDKGQWVKRSRSRSTRTKNEDKS